uniref:Negative regulator of ubiquitin-like proteins 1 n=1 Tax=Neogobius melanostomus TaxID=47308 RepID=A0A8C6SU20_9GOBI
EVGGALELIRAQAVNRGKGNQTFRETNVASLELLLPRDSKKVLYKKTLEHFTLGMIREEYGLKSVKLILNGRTLNVEQRLDEQGVRNHSKMMVLRVSDSEQQQEQEEERKNNQNQSLQRTQKGFQILSERAEDLDSQPFLEIALILAMGFHEKGRSLMKRRQFDDALCHLLQADQQFSKCGSTLLGSVDNFAVLQLDIVWCYRALEALSCLDDGRARLQRAEQSFVQCYGEQQQRLRMIKGSTGREEVLFLRLYLLQSLLAYIDATTLRPDSSVRHGEDGAADDAGFTEREARLGLRACEGDVQEAALHISKQETDEGPERQKRRFASRPFSVLAELGFNRRDAARALQQSNGNVDQAYTILLNSSQAAEATNNNSPELLYLGFDRPQAETALTLTDGDVQAAAQLLLENQGELPPDLIPSSSTTTSSSSTSSSSTNSPEDEAAVSEVLGDISRHEEDYLDLTLEEESELIVTLQSYLSRSTQTV